MIEVGVTAMRVDRLLVYLRFARTRSQARDLVEGHSLRLNRKHVRRASENVAIGDVLTLAVGTDIRVIEVVRIPERRASPALARTFYRDLAREGASDGQPEQTVNLTGQPKSP
jgi:ribosome-associated heat shock protein Hsp15